MPRGNIGQDRDVGPARSARLADDQLIGQADPIAAHRVDPEHKARRGGHGYHLVGVRQSQLHALHGRFAALRKRLSQRPRSIISSRDLNLLRTPI